MVTTSTYFIKLILLTVMRLKECKNNRTWPHVALGCSEPPALADGGAYCSVDLTAGRIPGLKGSDGGQVPAGVLLSM